MPRLTEHEADAHLLRNAIECVGRDADFRREYARSLTYAIVMGTMIGGLDEDDVKACRLLRTFVNLAPAMKERGEDVWLEFVRNVWERPEIRESDAYGLIALWGEGYDESEMMERVMERAETGDVKETTLLTFSDEVKRLHTIKERTKAMRTFFFGEE